MEFTKKNSATIQLLAGALAILAIWFAKMPCFGRAYEPEMPESLRKDI